MGIFILYYKTGLVPIRYRRKEYEIKLSRYEQEVVINLNADEDEATAYARFEKESMQAAENVLNDYDATIESLRHVAGSLKLCDNPRLRQLKYRRINFLNPRYFMLYRIEDNEVKRGKDE